MSDRRFISDKEFKDSIKSGDHEAGVGVHKGFPTEIKVISEAERLIDFTISTESVDRMWDTISVKGWDLKNYEQNPVILFGHDHSSPPIGKAVNVKKRPSLKRLTSRAKFMEKEISPFADMIFQMYLNGYMKATSVGFLPLEWAFEDDDEERRNHYGINFLKQELLEYSAVSVPANPEALMGAKSKGIDTSPLREYASQALDDYEKHQKSGLIIPKKTLEQLYKHSDPKNSKTFTISKEKQRQLAKENLERLEKQNKGNNEMSEFDTFLAKYGITFADDEAKFDAGAAYTEKLADCLYNSLNDDSNLAGDQNKIKEALSGVSEDAEWKAAVDVLFEEEGFDHSVETAPAIEAAPEVPTVVEDEVELDEVTDTGIEEVDQVTLTVADGDVPEAVIEPAVVGEIEKEVEAPADDEEVSMKFIVDSLENALEELENPKNTEKFLASKRDKRQLATVKSVAQDIVDAITVLLDEKISEEGVDKISEISDTYIEFEETTLSGDDNEEDGIDIDPEVLAQVIKDAVKEEVEKAISSSMGKVD